MFSSVVPHEASYATSVASSVGSAKRCKQGAMRTTKQEWRIAERLETKRGSGRGSETDNLSEWYHLWHQIGTSELTN